MTVGPSDTGRVGHPAPAWFSEWHHEKMVQNDGRGCFYYGFARGGGGEGVGCCRGGAPLGLLGGQFLRRKIGLEGVQI